MERCFAAPLERLWAALSQPAPLGEWLDGQVELELCPEGELTLRPPPGGGAEVFGRLLEIEPQRSLSLSWDIPPWGSAPLLCTKLRLEVEPAGHGARLRVTHALPGDVHQGHLFAATWSLRLERLDALLTGRIAGRVDPARVYELALRYLDEEAARERDRYARLLGLRPEPERTIEDLGLAAEQVRELQGWLDRDRGLILLAGQSEAGATTTHYACLRYLLAQGRRVSSAEDPIHAPLAGALQLEVDSARGRSLAAVARAALELESEVTLIARIDSAEVLELALEAAKGRLVISLLWGGEPEGVQERLSALAPPGVDLEDALLGVLHQEREASSLFFRLLGFNRTA